MPLIQVDDLSVTLPSGDGAVHAVRNVSFSVEPQEMFGIVGESGSGKSVLAQTILGLLPQARTRGHILFDGQDLTRVPPRVLRSLRGNRIALISQDPLSALHPFYTVGAQIAEAIRAHRPATRSEARAEAAAMLGRVGIAAPEARAQDYPHQFSGGMRQRVMIAMALALKPALLIADEPTTALDVTIQTQIIELIDAMRRDLGTAVMMVSHDLTLLTAIADHTMVMYAGHRMEIGRGADVLGQPRHPYTRGLIASSPAAAAPGAPLQPVPGQPPSLLATPAGCVFAPRCAQADATCRSKQPPLRDFANGGQALCWHAGEPVAPAPATPPGAPRPARPAGAPPVQVHDLRLSYASRGFTGRARVTEVLKGVSLTLDAGQTLGIVGESGCGKSTLARVIAGLVRPDAGRVEIGGRDTASFTPADWQQVRRTVQMVFQDPFGSLNPRRRVGAIIGDPFRIQRVCRGAERRARVRALMEQVGLNPEHYNRFPAEFSGGQRQRIGIARALALNPRVIIFDEPVSALDVSIQAQILNLVRRLQHELGLSYIFISHDLSVVRHVSDRVAVMKAGEVVEEGPAAALYAAPRHPYTRELLHASHLRAAAGGPA